MDNNFKFSGKHIGFDFDGTLADSLTLYLDIYNGIAKENGLRFGTLQNIEEIRTSMVSLTDLIKFMTGFGINIFQFPFFIKKMFTKLRERNNELLLFPGVEDLLDDLKTQGYDLYIITSNQQEIVENILNSKKLTKYFNGIYALDFMGNKGNKLAELIRELKIEPDKFLYIGDEVRDIRAARKAQTRVISVTWGLNTTQLLQKNNPDAIADNLDQLRHLLTVPY